MAASNSNDAGPCRRRRFACWSSTTTTPFAGRTRGSRGRWIPSAVAEDGLCAAELLAHTAFHVIVSDVTMPGMGGLGLLRLIRERDLEVAVIFVTGTPDIATAREAIDYGACQYLTKPVELARLAQVVRRAAGLWRLARLKREAMAAFESGKFVAGDRAGLEVTFARAIEGLSIVYQPIVDGSSHALYGTKR